MKKLIILLLSFALLSACGGTGEETTNEGPGKPSIDVPPEEVLKVEVEATYDEAGPFSEGFAVVGQKQGKTMKYNYINKEGELLLNNWVDRALPFSEGKAAVGYINEHYTDAKNTIYNYQYIDTKGQQAIQEEWMGTKNAHPNAFYQGYAEVNYFDPAFYDGEWVETALVSIVIDEKGSYLFQFAAAYEASYFYDIPSRYLEVDLEHIYTSGHTWMRNFVYGTEDEHFPVLQFYDGNEVSHIVNKNGQILASVPGYVMQILDTDYYIFYNSQQNSLMDKKGDILMIDIVNYKPGLDNQHVITFFDENYIPYDIIYLNDFMPMNHLPYRSVTIHDKHYYGLDATTGTWTRFDKNGNITVEAELPRAIEELSSIIDWSQEEKAYTNFLRGGYYDSDGNSYQYIYNTLLDLIAVIENGSYTFIDKNHLGINEDNEFRIIDDQGTVCATLKNVGSIYYEDNMLVEYSNSEIPDYTYYHYENNNGKITITEAEDLSEELFTFIENEECTIKGTYSEDIEDLYLFDKEGNEIRKAKILSPIVNGIYYYAEECEVEEIDYLYHYHYDKVHLVDTKTNFESKAYEDLGPLSEGLLPYKENGKWGYLSYQK